MTDRTEAIQARVEKPASLSADAAELAATSISDLAQALLSELRAAQADLSRIREYAKGLSGDKTCYPGETISQELAALASASPQKEDDVDPCHGPDDRWCPSCGLGGSKP